MHDRVIRHSYSTITHSRLQTQRATAKEEVTSFYFLLRVRASYGSERRIDEHTADLHRVAEEKRPLTVDIAPTSKPY